ncbi:hypothetical protein LP420_21065 [Massilia sp. B-10]|nr:hypothetical protein LP420_21065 [Massilia sp. B-10]UUZ57053.1 hypothetical protein LP419_20505 [Massilia sp. H-1]
MSDSASVQASYTININNGGTFVHGVAEDGATARSGSRQPGPRPRRLPTAT